MGLRPCEHLLLSCSAARLPVTSSSLIALLLASIGMVDARSQRHFKIVEYVPEAGLELAISSLAGRRLIH